MGSYFQIGSGSPLDARAGFPIGLFIVGVILVATIVCGIWILTKHLLDYKKSDKYIQKQLERLTTQKDVKKFSETNRLTPAMSTLLWDICKTMKMPNINYLIKQPEVVAQNFKEYYYKIKNQNISAEDLNIFFELNFTLEKISAATKSLLSTKQFPLESVVFYPSK